MTVCLLEPAVAGAKRISVRVDEQVWDELNALAAHEGITMSDRLAAMVELWHTNDSFREQVNLKAREVAAETRKRRYEQRRSSP